MQKFKVLIIGNFGPGAIEKMYLNSFLQLGLDVVTFDIQTPLFTYLQSSMINKIKYRFHGINDSSIQNINSSLIRYSEKLKLDLILVFKGMELYPQTIEMLSQRTKIIANYNPDNPLNFFARGSGNTNISNSINKYHIHFSYSKEITNKLKQKFDANAFTIPFGFDSSIRAKPITELSNSVVFIGAFDLERAKALSKLFDVEVKIYGEQKWRTRSIFYPKLKNMYQNKSLYGQDYIDVTHSALGAINLLRKQNIIEQTHNMRTFEVPGCGGILLSNRTDEHLEFFEENKEALYFDTIDELKSQIKGLINLSDSKVEKMKQAAYKRALESNYSYLDRAKLMLSIVNKFLH